MKFRFIVLSLCVVFGLNVVKAQNSGKQEVCSDNRYEIRFSVSDGLTLGTSSVLGVGLADAILGNKRVDERASLVYGVGYRYALNRFRVGGDFAFATVESKLQPNGSESPAVKERELNFMVLPAADFVYYKRGLLELYGSASAGVNLLRHSEKGLTEEGKSLARKKADLSCAFAYQVNPIAVRVGNNFIGGFVEVGLGYKGYLTAGLSLKF